MEQQHQHQHQHQHQPEQQQQQKQELREPEAEQASELYKPCLKQDDRAEDKNLRDVELMSIDQCDNIREMDDSQLVGAPDTVMKDADVAVRGSGGMVDVEVKLAGKRKRGRPPKGEAKPVSRPPPPPRKNDDEEDVCFICFDGGSLVLCDRRGCPKAYHPSCIKRDESFFRSKAKWNCGWHICSSCQKASYYMCYTCTYSLCKGCTKDADYVLIRGNKGLCGICKKTIMLIENVAQSDEEKVQVDFDDKTSWEYLFKVYWTYLKDKLSLTLNELTQAKNPWKEPATPVPKRNPVDELYDGNCNRSSRPRNLCLALEANHPKRRKSKKYPEFFNKVNTPSTGKLGIDKGISLSEGANWATKELLEFVAHMKNGDTSMLSQFDVQSLLLEYIKRNDLRDPRQKSQIICDSRLLNIFGKARVGHFEMLKLLESHFLIQENSAPVYSTMGGLIDAVAVHMEADANHDNRHNDKRHRARKKDGNGGAKISPDKYAAIDVHNINLIYLKRSLMEDLIGEADKFHEKVVGSIVRIKIPGSDEKQDMHRLVQVIGTSKMAEPYNIGDPTANFKLEILNLNKKEVISIDGISNQDFSEDECKRFRQSIKCGLIKHLTVGEIQEKAATLQALRVNDFLESEITRLTHLRDRASEKGHRKELRECIEKLELLNSPDERKRRLLEIPQIHTDSTMDPSYDSEEDAGEFNEKKSGNRVRPRHSTGTLNLNTNMCSTFYVDKDGTARVLERVNEFPWEQGIESVSPSCSTGIGQPIINFETDRLWHYQDPTGKTQGPFSIAQLRKWNTSGHFPPDLRVWMINEKPDESILLTDALVGRYHKDPSLMYKRLSLHLQVRAFSDDEGKAWDDEWGGKTEPADKAMERVEEDFDFKQVGGGVHYEHIDELVKSNGWGSSSSCSTTHSDVINSLFSPTPSEKIDVNLSDQVKDSLGGEMRKSDQTSLNSDLQKPANGQNSSGHSQEKRVDNEGSSSQSSGENQRPPSIDRSSNVLNSKSNGLDFLAKALGLPNDSQENSPISNDDAEAKKSMSSDVPLQDSGPSCSTASSPLGSGPQLTLAPTTLGKPNETLIDQVKENQGDERWKDDQGFLNRVSHENPDGKTDRDHDCKKQNDNSETNSGQSFNWRPPSSNGLDSNNSGFVTLENSLQIPNQNQEIDFSCLPSPARNSNQGGLNNQVNEIKQSVSLDVEEWDSGIMHPSSSLKPAEVTSDHAATPTSESWQAIVVTEPEDFTALVDESVSDLLAEVEAMESLNGIASPTSSLRCGAENECFSPVRGLSPTHDQGKSDAFSSSSELQMHSQSTVTEEPLGVSHADILNPQKSSHRQSSSGEDAKLSNDSVNRRETGPEIKPPLPPATSWATTSGNMTNMEYRGIPQESMTMGYGTHWATTPEHANIYSGGYAGHPSIWGSQPRNAGDRYSSPRDHREYHGRDSSYGRSRSMWNNRQSMHGGGGGSGGSYRPPPPKGQRVCKFYESGYCKKGASCSYWHP